jgi:hypothetical protein
MSSPVVRDVIAYLVGRLPRPPLRTTLVEYVYLGDWLGSRDFGRSVTGLTWRFDRHGPFAPAVLRAARDLDTERIVSERWSSSPRGRYYMYSCGQRSREPELEPWVRGVLNDVVQDFGDLHLDALLETVYEMEPMPSADRGEALSLPSRQQQYSDLRTRAYRRRKNLGERAPDNDDGLPDDLAEMVSLQLRPLAGRFLEDD